MTKSKLKDIMTVDRPSFIMRNTHDIMYMRYEDIAVMLKALNDKFIPSYDEYLAINDKTANVTTKAVQNLGIKLLEDIYALFKNKNITNLVLKDNSSDRFDFDKNVTKEYMLERIVVRITKYSISKILLDFVETDKSLSMFLQGESRNLKGEIITTIPGSFIRLVTSVLLRKEELKESDLWNNLEKLHEVLENQQVTGDALKVIMSECNKRNEDNNEKLLETLENKLEKNKEMISNYKRDIAEVKEENRKYKKNVKELNTELKKINIKLEAEKSAKDIALEITKQKQDELDDLKTKLNSQPSDNKEKEFKEVIFNLEQTIESLKEKINQRDLKIKNQLEEIQHLKTELYSIIKSESELEKLEESRKVVNKVELDGYYGIASMNDKALSVYIPYLNQTINIESIKEYKPLPVSDSCIVKFSSKDGVTYAHNAFSNINLAKQLNVRFIGKILKYDKDRGSTEVIIGDAEGDTKTVYVDGIEYVQNNFIALDKNFKYIKDININDGKVDKRYDHILKYTNLFYKNARTYIIEEMEKSLLGDTILSLRDATVVYEDSETFLLQESLIVGKNNNMLKIGNMILLDINTEEKLCKLLWVFNNSDGYKMSSLYASNIGMYFLQEGYDKSIRNHSNKIKVMACSTNTEVDSYTEIVMDEVYFSNISKPLNNIFIVDELTNEVIKVVKIDSSIAEKVERARCKRNEMVDKEVFDYPNVIDTCLVIGSPNRRDSYIEAFKREGVEIEFVSNEDGLGLLENSMRRHDKIVFNITAVPHVFQKKLRKLEKGFCKSIAYPQTQNVKDQIQAYKSIFSDERVS